MDLHLEWDVSKSGPYLQEIILQVIPVPQLPSFAAVAKADLRIRIETQKPLFVCHIMAPDLIRFFDQICAVSLKAVIFLRLLLRNGASCADHSPDDSHDHRGQSHHKSRIHEQAGCAALLPAGNDHHQTAHQHGDDHEDGIPHHLAQRELSFGRRIRRRFNINHAGVQSLQGSGRTAVQFFLLREKIRGRLLAAFFRRQFFQAGLKASGILNR